VFAGLKGDQEFPVVLFLLLPQASGLEVLADLV